MSGSLCPDKSCEGHVRYVDGFSDGVTATRNWECDTCGKLWQSEEKFVGQTEKKYLRANSSYREPAFAGTRLRFR